MVFVSAVLFAGAQTKKPSTSTTKPAAKPAATKPAASQAIFKSNIDSASYAIGVSLYRNFERDGLSNVNIALLHKALTDMQQKKKPALDDAAIGACLGALQQRISAEKNAEATKVNAAQGLANRKEAEQFLSNNAKRQGVVTLPSGMQYEVLQQGNSDQKPQLTSRVRCHYTGTLLNGTKFDSSVDRGEPATFPVNGVIAGWQQALPLMTVGSKWKLYIPADLAYGDNAPGDVIQPGSLLVFEVELLGIEQ